MTEGDVVPVKLALTAAAAESVQWLVTLTALSIDLVAAAAQ